MFLYFKCFDRNDFFERIDVNKTNASKSVIFVTTGIS